MSHYIMQMDDTFYDYKTKFSHLPTFGYMYTYGVFL